MAQSLSEQEMRAKSEDSSENSIWLAQKRFARIIDFGQAPTLFRHHRPIPLLQFQHVVVLQPTVDDAGLAVDGKRDREVGGVVVGIV